MVEFVARPAAEAFLEVTVFVAAMIGLFGYLQLRCGDRMSDFLATRWRCGPLLGALVGVIPGCGGAILVTPLYAHGRVSFGTVIAALIATMGDSSFVIMAANPSVAVLLHGILFVTGATSGFLVDALGIRPRLRTPGHIEPSRHPVAASVAAPSASHGLPAGPVAGEGGPAPPDRSPVRSRRSGVRSTAELWPILFWLLVGLGALVTVPDLFQGSAPVTDPAGTSGGAPDTALLVGLAGTLSAAALAYRERRARRLGLPRREVSDVIDVLRTSAVESARIAMWVTTAFLAMEVVTLLGVSIVAMVSVVGIGGVLVGSALGLVPGCAPQIVLTGLYVSGGLPFPTLLANALSQDGDALLPMLLMERRSAVVASVITTIPGIVAGSLVLLTDIGP